MNDEDLARLWCDLNAKKRLPQYEGREYEVMQEIEKKIGKQACLAAWNLMQLRRKR